MTDLAYTIGDFFTWTFGILEMLGNIPNYAFIAIGFIGGAFWLMMQSKFSKEAKKKGTLV